MQGGLVLQQPPGVQSQRAGGVQAGQWSTGLCDCYEDMNDCCCALWCLPVFACKTSSAAGACACLPLLDCVGCVPPASLAVRATVRERFGIQGNVWSDCFFGCCCYALSWCQISREIKRRAATLASPRSAGYSPLTPLQGAHLY
ncbi:cornifelin homolog B-like [Megalops cyprinoides]|uniref:cornifelin homolog B-like n=1 Tax=Megalops cyprinoides TaxID=118141 RepID=UPI0018651EBB|nr:cornifelin homolog B-like [Megalops cyprinoides]XP_036403525.1 cornifelin homolog B-like [Megalops cyprinoides]